ncbi:2-amino-4-hydroxy-6- hydroxymethyldihydropteridine pyrophosphokinase / GTP cyclohydrolase I type 1 [Lactococcus lactis subsp. lactis]|uniref:GTP cyclohydrolase I FolE n=1 Tax=Lactococcus lactis TaxID=1358 RepID=UPI00071DBD9F|nr:GTP cyclohydrolase I FolE [Lactococcus lactis]KST84505.1 2-amino-4-hydroxy-6- hydroxymethyldihydropteridine pyrophosphokinase / GTP cyclohydrolase I type 1 [Lactococcus lactis subsp. lactis]
MQTTYLSMGSNIGDRQYYLHEAIRLLGKHPKIMIEKVSNFYESTPVGGVKQDDFTNLALKVATLLEPLELLSFIHEVELSLNRERKIHWGPRTIDIDIIFYGDLEMQEENLVIPHKEAFNRLFVLKPIFELIDKDFKYYASIEKAIAELSVSEQELHVIKEEKTPRNRIEDAVKEILFAVGENPNREGLLETPVRVAKMYEEILSSQRLSKFNEYKLFEIDSSKTDSIVLIKDIPFYSMCEHHMLPFFGKAHVAYIPADGKIIGLSKIPRLVDYVSRKLSVQENITHDIGDILTDILNPKGVAVLVEGRHMCVEMRGVKKVNSITKTSYFLGEFKENNEKRMEFLESLL